MEPVFFRWIGGLAFFNFACIFNSVHERRENRRAPFSPPFIQKEGKNTAKCFDLAFDLSLFSPLSHTLISFSLSLSLFRSHSIEDALGRVPPIHSFPTLTSKVRVRVFAVGEKKKKEIFSYRLISPFLLICWFLSI